MSAASEIKVLLEADAILLASATGGIWDYDETGRLGLSLETTPGAYTAAGIIKPAIVVKGRGARPQGQINDEAARTLSTREIVEIWFYQDEGYDTIATMRNRVFTLLHEVRVEGTFRAQWAGNILANMTDDEMGNISVERDDYAVTALKSA